MQRSQRNRVVQFTVETFSYIFHHMRLQWTPFPHNAACNSHRRLFLMWLQKVWSLRTRYKRTRRHPCPHLHHSEEPVWRGSNSIHSSTSSLQLREEVSQPALLMVPARRTHLLARAMLPRALFIHRKTFNVGALFVELH